jgi:hypothetical protein
MVLVILVPLLWLTRRLAWRRRLLMVITVTIACLAGLWFLQRLVS